MLVTNVGGLPDLVPDYKVGLVAEPTVASIAAKIEELYLLGENYFLPNILSEKKKYFILASIAIGGGMITKGPIALFVPIFAFGSHWILQRNFKFLFNPIYLIGILIIGIILIPMSIGLYEQFDLHPEKIIEGKKNVSGLRFFYWTQSFGRITGESVWDNNAHFSFLFENLLWGMLPWSLFFIVATISDWIKIIKNKFLVGKSEEFITTGGIVLTYCSLGVSKYNYLITYMLYFL